MAQTEISSSSAFPPILLEGLTPAPNIVSAAALLVSTDGRYLFQLRDDKPLLPLRNHWGLFGGAVETGEDGRAAILREIEEELNYKARDCTWYHEAIFVLPMRNNRVVRRSFYLMHMLPDDIDDMTLNVGAEMRLMTPQELTGLRRVAPWDLSAVLLHAREKTLFADG